METQEKRMETPTVKAHKTPTANTRRKRQPSVPLPATSSAPDGSDLEEHFLHTLRQSLATEEKTLPFPDLHEMTSGIVADGHITSEHQQAEEPAHKKPTEQESRVEAELFAGGGEMGALVRAFDWTATSLGPLSTWPQSLRTAVDLCLSSRFPTIIFLGTALIQVYNDAFRPVLGTRKHPSALGQRAHKCWAEIWDRIGPLCESVFATGQAVWAEKERLLVNRQGHLEECYFTFSFTPIRDEAGKVVGIFVPVVEETQQTLSDKRVLESMVEGVAMIDEHYLIVFTNPAFDAMFGYERGALLGQHVSAALAEGHDQFLTEMSEWARTQAGWRGEVSNRKKDGTLFTTYARISGTNVAGKQHFVAVQQDLSERKRLTEALQEKEQQFRAIFEEAAIGIALTTLDGRIAVSNPALQEMLGYSRDELHNLPFRRLLHPEERQTAIALYQELVQEKRSSVQMEGRYTHKDRSLGWCRLITALTRDSENGEPLFMVSTVEDITQHKQAEEKLRESARLATMGATAAKLAHEIGNPLNGMYTTIQLLERHLAKHKERADDVLTSTMQDLTHEIHRLRALLQEFLALARPHQLALQPIDLAVVVREVLAIEAPQYHEQGILIRQEFPKDLPPVLADREKLKQVLLNLCKNAVEAMPQGGTLTVRGDNAGEYVALEVMDTGEGIPEGMDIFELFTTTKPGGTGLGLAIVRQIVAAHRGTITYNSTPRQGATFRVTLPPSIDEGK